jgi:hypothetical protein
MAIEKTINLNVDSKKATKGLNDLEKSIDGVNKEVKETSKSTQAMSGTLDKATGGAVSKFAAFKGAISGVTTGFKSLKVAIIGTGIGALLIAVTSLSQAFTRSEEGQNKFAKILGVIGSVTGNLLDLLADLGENIISVFENPKQSIKDFANLIKDNIVNRFEGLLNLIPNLGKAVEQLFKGNFKEAGKIAADSVGKVVLGVDSVTDSLDNAVESVKAFGKEIKADSEAASKIADQRATAEKKARDLIVSRAQAEQDIARLREKAVNKDKFTAEERIKFLEEAGKISEDLAAKETEVAKLRLEAKQTENALTKSNKDDLNEAAQLEASVIQLETQRLNLQKRLSTELLTARNEAKKAAEEEPEVIDKKLLKIQEIQEAYRQKQKDKDAETELEKINLEEERKLAELDRLKATKEQKQEVEDYYDGLRLDNKIALDKAEAELDKQKIADKKAVVDAISQFADAESGIGKALLLIKQGLALQETIMDLKRITFKGVEAVGSAGVSTAQNVAESSKIGFPQNIITIGSAIAQGVGIISSVKKAVSKTKAKAGASASASVPSISTPSIPTSLPPSFNVVGATETSVLSDAVAGQTNQPVQAYVVANDVTTAQSLENNIVEGATI